MRRTPSLLAVLSLLCLTPCAFSAIQFDQDVTPDIIFGSGNANGGFTTDRSNGVELGLRGKLRHNASGAPENTFNSNGDGTYSFMAGVAPTQSFPTAEWSFEWSINTNYDGSSALNLDDLTYTLALDTNPSSATSFITFDPINGVNPGNGSVLWDHALGTNATPNGGGITSSTAGVYATNIAANNVAQNSWKPHWFIGGFDPTVDATYDFVLTATGATGPVASTSIQIIVGDGGRVVPEAASFLVWSVLGTVVTTMRFGRRR